MVDGLETPLRAPHQAAAALAVSPPTPDAAGERTPDSATSDADTLRATVARLSARLAAAEQELADVRSEKEDLEMLLETTTEHSDHMEEELQARVEATLRESEHRFRLIAETMPVPVMISRIDSGAMVYANAPAAALVGMSNAEFLGQPITSFYHHPATADTIAALLAAHGSVSNYEVQGRRSDGTPIWVELSVQRITYNDEACHLTALYDVTERKRAEQERLQLTANLENALQTQVALTRAYSRFVPQEILTFLDKQSITEVQLGDQIQQHMSVLFSDIRNFTTLSEQMSPHENFRFLNSYLGRVGPIIREYHGYIDKYIGDAIMAIFPGQNFAGQADDALNAAVAMQQEVVRYNEHRARQGYDPISIGIGIHTGSVMLGTIGESERMEGTVISDAVNLAARLEGLTRLYGASIIVSDRVLFSLEQRLPYQFRFLDKVRVKGKQEPVSVFEIFDGVATAQIERKLETQTDFEKGLLHYYTQEFHDAFAYFKRVVERNPTDKAAHIYLKRVQTFIDYGVPPDWEGIEVMTEK